MLAGRHPVPLGGGVNLENMGPGAEDRLLPEKTVMRIYEYILIYRKKENLSTDCTSINNDFKVILYYVDI